MEKIVGKVIFCLKKSSSCSSIGLIPTVQFSSSQPISFRQTEQSVSDINSSLFSLNSFKCFMCVFVYTQQKPKAHLRCM